MKESSTTRPRFTASASSDCHTCSSSNHNCKRQRPYCSTCLERGVDCGGYATPLSWHESRAFSTKSSFKRRQPKHDRMFTSQNYRSSGLASLMKARAGSSGSFRVVETRPQPIEELSNAVAEQHSEIRSEKASSSPEEIDASRHEETDLSKATNIDSILENFASRTCPETMPDEYPSPLDMHSQLDLNLDSARFLWMLGSGEGSQQSRTRAGSNIENENEYSQALATMTPATSSATTFTGFSSLSPRESNTLDTSWGCSNITIEDSIPLVDAEIFSISAPPEVDWRQQREMALDYCKILSCNLYACSLDLTKTSYR